MNKFSKKIKSVLLAIVALILLSSCIFVPTEEANLQYVYDMYGLDYNIGDKFYLNNCIWYEDPMTISSMNYIKGKVISVGEEIEFIKSFPGYVIFKTVKDGKKYRIYNNTDNSLLNDKIQFHRLISNENPLKNLKVSEKALLQMKNGVVVKGMTKEQVRHIYGLPPKAFNPLVAKVTWVYFIDAQFKARHVIFSRKNQVNFMFDC